MDLPPLVDHHCHGVMDTDPTPEEFASCLTESAEPPAPGADFADSQLGFALRRWCPPVLGLEPHCPYGDYLAGRGALGPAESGRRLLAAAGIGTFLVDTGLPGTGPGSYGGGTEREVVRLERLAEEVARTAADARGFTQALGEAIAAKSRTAVGFKSIAAYRHGLDFNPAPPAAGEVRGAAARWLDAGAGRLTDPVLLRHLLWSAVRTGLPLQLHTGFGDPDLALRRCDPLLLTDFVRAVHPTGTPLVLLHGYPYHRSAGYLAHVFPHVYADVGLALSHTGARAEAVLAEMLELTPFGKLLFSTDAYALAELYVVGAELFRTALGRLLRRWTDDGDWAAADADRVAYLLAAGNARRVYRLSP
ncbi:hypothetical protein SRB5_05690 [Streptomyces sp. RB5]|uniref:Amidohydrolase-related domain-containing protein n=1 Tax=Streptomyces smaragdinus TaxID=2585196 RepID=A0A7K0CAI0_9ACTN|nr:amidohydrolase family protein [Streptomyces smaragdinus]MQY10461.1 hypothetical protein [Streptomyces smaragdinus]